MTDRRQWAHISPFLDERAGEYGRNSALRGGLDLRAGAAAMPVGDSALLPWTGV
jgi:hypothetical protein